MASTAPQASRAPEVISRAETESYEDTAQRRYGIAPGHVRPGGGVFIVGNIDHIFDL